MAAAYNRFPGVAADLEGLRGRLQDHLAREARTHELQVTRQKRRVGKLEDERVMLLQAHLAGAVPLDLMKTEQDRLQRERGDAERLLERAEADRSHVMVTFEQVVEWLAKLDEESYLALPEQDKRQHQPAPHRPDTCG